MILALQTRCKFCAESAPFYKQVADKTSKQSALHLVAVFPQEADAAKAFLDSLGVSVRDIRQAPLNALGVSGTPTILLLDNTGLITEAWLGRLDPEREAEVLRQIP
jgi:thioredoxin-related protein